MVGSIITISLICVVLAGNPFVPPDDWKVEKIEIPMNYSYVYTLGYQQPFTLESTEQTVNVHLKRELNPGEIVEPPKQCVITIKNVKGE